MVPRTTPALNTTLTMSPVPRRVRPGLFYCNHVTINLRPPVAATLVRVSLHMLSNY